MLRANDFQSSIWHSFKQPIQIFFRSEGLRILTSNVFLPQKLPEDGSTKWGSKPSWHEVADPPEKRSEGEFRMMPVAGGPSGRLSQLTTHGDLLAKLSETFQKDTVVNAPQRHLNIRDGGSFSESENTGCTENTKSKPWGISQWAEFLPLRSCLDFLPCLSLVQDCVWPGTWKKPFSHAYSSRKQSRTDTKYKYNQFHNRNTIRPKTPRITPTQWQWVTRYFTLTISGWGHLNKN